MRVVVLHSYYSYSRPSGENAAVDNQLTALAAAGHDVVLVKAETDERARRPLHAVRVALEIALGREPDPWKTVAALGPDVVHVHNTFPNWSNRNLSDCARHVPVIWTAHNYRVFCSAGILSRSGNPFCVDCPTGHPWAAVRHACYRGSRLATLPVAMTRRFSGDPLVVQTDRIVTLSAGMREDYVRFGVPREKLAILPNFLPSAAVGRMGSGGNDFVVVGRLTPEKGIRELVQAWPAEVGLVILGAGPEEKAIMAESAGKRIHMMGQVPPATVHDVLSSSLGLVFPSLCREGLPMSYLESLSAGTPVLALSGNEVAQLVGRQGTGVVTTWDSLPDAVERAGRSFPELRATCRAAFLEHYTEDHYVKGLERIYSDAVAQRERPLLA